MKVRLSFYLTQTQVNKYKKLKERYDGLQDWLEEKTKPYAKSLLRFELRIFLKMIVLAEQDECYRVTSIDYNRVLRYFRSMCRNYVEMYEKGREMMQLIDRLEFGHLPSCNVNPFWCFLACLRFSPLDLAVPPKDVRKLLYRAFVRANYSSVLMCGRMEAVAEGRKWASAEMGVPDWQCILCSHHCIVNCVSKLDFEQMHLNHFAEHHPGVSYWDIVSEKHALERFEGRVRVFQSIWSNLHPSLMNDIQSVIDMMEGDMNPDYAAGAAGLVKVVNSYYGEMRDFVDATLSMAQGRTASCISMISAMHSKFLSFSEELKNDNLLTYLQECGHSVLEMMMASLEEELEWLGCSVAMADVYKSRVGRGKHLLNLSVKVEHK